MADEARKDAEENCSDLGVMSVLSKSDIMSLPEKVASAIEMGSMSEDTATRIQEDLASETVALKCIPSKYPNIKSQHANH